MTKLKLKTEEDKESDRLAYVAAMRVIAGLSFIDEKKAAKQASRDELDEAKRESRIGCIKTARGVFVGRVKNGKIFIGTSYFDAKDGHVFQPESIELKHLKSKE